MDETDIKAIDVIRNHLARTGFAHFDASTILSKAKNKLPISRNPIALDFDQTRVTIWNLDNASTDLDLDGVRRVEIQIPRAKIIIGFELRQFIKITNHHTSDVIYLREEVVWWEWRFRSCCVHVVCQWI